MAAILVYGTGISSFLFKYFVLFHHPTGATDHVSENDLLLFSVNVSKINYFQNLTARSKLINKKVVYLLFKQLYLASLFPRLCTKNTVLACIYMYDYIYNHELGKNSEIHTMELAIASLNPQYIIPYYFHTISIIWKQ